MAVRFGADIASILAAERVAVLFIPVFRAF
jgi:hypothetical protein